MKNEITYAQSQIEKFKSAMAECHESMSNFYYQKVLAWQRHEADLKQKFEQQQVAQ